MEKENRASQTTEYCRKDMQCKCPMCLDSFQATRDLLRPLPSNNAFHSITNLENTFRSVFATSTPPRFKGGKDNNYRGAGNDEKVCTPVNPRLLQSSRLRSLDPQEAELHPRESRPHGLQNLRGNSVCKVFAAVVCIAMVMVTLPTVMSRLYPPSLSGDEVSGIAIDSRVRTSVYDRFDYIRRRLAQSLPEQNVSSCTGRSAAWRLKDGHHLVHSACTFYSSSAESVTVWGFPVKTAGVLGRTTRLRSFTVISGRLLEWREGGMDYEIYQEGDSWSLPQWAASAVHLEGNTWLVEYKQGLLSGLGSPTGIAQILGHQLRTSISHWRAAFDATTLAYLGAAGLRIEDGAPPT